MSVIGQLAPFAKHHDRLGRSVEFHKMVVVVVRSLFRVNYHIFWLIFRTYINGKWLKGLLECYIVLRRNQKLWSLLLIRFYGIRLKFRHSNEIMISKGNGLLECKCHFSDRWLFTKFLALKVAFINKRFHKPTRALITRSISNQNTVSSIVGDFQACFLWRIVADLWRI